MERPMWPGTERDLQLMANEKLRPSILQRMRTESCKLPHAWAWKQMALRWLQLADTRTAACEPEYPARSLIHRNCEMRNVWYIAVEFWGNCYVPIDNHPKTHTINPMKGQTKDNFPVFRVSKDWPHFLHFLLEQENKHTDSGKHREPKQKRGKGNPQDDEKGGPRASDEWQLEKATGSGRSPMIKGSMKVETSLAQW